MIIEKVLLELLKCNIPKNSFYYCKEYMFSNNYKMI